ncbi:ribosomal-protein-alanine N-acetyltransferase [Bacillus pakistanensis]|uniref:Ribosomal-protein-alanine N-acetyltransferase n=1 Tax=Rossellomorea pakistanensis TaxID=992288 RepID=A0ABS2NIY5_9BACI|nr:GNAT family protein [Bacillus pakistanensis]MBM7587770.1 ribosomal-protein-alanine N-acetyltransferase [Bacillus pakistanensis]
MLPELRTDNLILREITEQDAQALFEYFSSDKAMQFYGMNPLTTLEQMKNIVKGMASGYEKKQAIRWGIQLKDQQELIGTIGFNNWSNLHKKAELGYDLNPRYWRKGYMFEAISKVIQFGFEEILLNRIGAFVYLDNEASNRILEKIGFHQEGILKDYYFSYDRYHDVYVYRLLQSEFL